MSNRGDDDYVGYGRPPRHGQFRMGRSGNPGGRPKKSKEAKQLIERSDFDERQRAVLDQKVSVTEGGRKRTRKAIDVVMRSQTAQAMKGQTLAQRDFLRRSQELETREARRRLTPSNVSKMRRGSGSGWTEIPTGIWLSSRPNGKGNGTLLFRRGEMSRTFRGPIPMTSCSIGRARNGASEDRSMQVASRSIAGSWRNAIWRLPR